MPGPVCTLTKATCNRTTALTVDIATVDCDLVFDAAVRGALTSNKAWPVQLRERGARIQTPAAPAGAVGL
jgi:hypothetical protein